MFRKVTRIIKTKKRQTKSFFDCVKSSMKYKGPVNHKVKYLSFLLLARKNRVVPFRWNRIADLYTYDYFNNHKTSKQEKKWAYAHGFNSYKMADWYGLTKENYQSFISDFVFYHPRNYIQTPELLSLYEHKCCTFFSLQPFKDSLPRHYYFLRNKRIIPLDVCSNGDASIQSIVSLIKERPIAAKACIGGHGAGFLKLVYSNNERSFFVNNQERSQEDLVSLLGKLDNYIITDFESPRQEYQDLCGTDSFAVIRIITVFDKEDGPQLTAALVRLGCKQAGVTTDHEGTIYCGLSLEEGVSFKPLIRVADNLYVPCPEHPDTHLSMSGFVIPRWEDLRKLVLNVSAYLAVTPYLVMDIIPTEKGFSILEINSHGQVGNMEPFYPFFENKYNRRAFHVE